MSAQSKKKGWFDVFLDGLEKACNKLPVPAIMFFYLFIIIAIISCILANMGISAVNPATNEVVAVQNPISSDGLLWFLDNMVKNFTGFAPLGLVLTMTIAIGMCEESGLIVALLNDKLRNIPPAILPFVIAFVGVCGNLASDTAMVVIPPIAAILYIGAGKHPVVGMINGYAGAQAGFSANLMIAGTDSLLQGITNTVLDGFLGEGKYHVDVTCNWFFMIASTFLCAAVIGLVCNLIVDKRFGEYVPGEDVEVPQLEAVRPEEKKALGAAGIAALIYLVIVLIGYFVGPLAKINEDGSRAFVGSPLLKGLIPILFFFFSIPGIVYGFKLGKFKTSKDVNNAMVHEEHGLLCRVLLRLRTVQLAVQLDQARHRHRYRRRRCSCRGGLHRIRHAGRHHPSDRLHQPPGSLRLRKVGDPGSGLRPDADAPGISPRLHPADLPSGRLPDQRVHSALSVHLGHPERCPGQV